MPSPERRAAIVPIRSWTTGKSRLSLDDFGGGSLAQAFALDVVRTLSSSREVDRVVVVTADEEVRAVFDGCDLVDDRGNDLNDAVSRGCAHAVAVGCSHIVIVPADLPCLTARALAEVLSMAGTHTHSFCPDADGDGTTVVVSRDPAHLLTSYGAGSAAAHEAAGLVPLLGAPPEARRDVDTVQHLHEAESLGVRGHTADVVKQLSVQRLRR